MDRDQAREMVLETLNSTYSCGDDHLVILDDLTISKPYGWVFFFNSQKYLTTGNPLYALGGNGPVVFDVATGKVTPLGSAIEPEEAIRRFEEARRVQ